MKLDAEFFSSPTGQLVTVGAVLLLGGGALIWQHRSRPAAPPAAKVASPAVLPRTFTREGTKIQPRPAAPVAPAVASAAPERPPAPRPEPKPTVLPLTLFVTESRVSPVTAPYGRLIPCETVVTLESNHLDTPVIGLVTEDVWHDGRLVIPAGAEVHGRAALDPSRERLAASGSWMIVWRTPGRDNGSELTVQGLALDRETDPVTGRWGEQDGSAGLRGEVLKTGDERELKLFAATFLSTATAALQDTRTATGLLGDAAVPATTARNATLAGTGAVLREYAQQLRESIARDGFYLRVPAGKPFYLYVTQTLDRSQAKPAPARL